MPGTLSKVHFPEFAALLPDYENRATEFQHKEKQLKLNVTLSALVLAVGLQTFAGAVLAEKHKKASEPAATVAPASRSTINIPMVAIPGMNYEMGKTEVTQGQWKAITGNNPSRFRECGDNCPVEKVSWTDVQEFLQKLNAQTGKQYRLPSGYEWEYACYGGSKSEYCGGGDLDDVGWYKDNSSEKTHPVGLKKANGYGLYDLSGNVSEWLQEEYGSEYDFRSYRGGAWNNEASHVRASNRGGNSPGARFIDIGFRIVRTLP